MSDNDAAKEKAMELAEEARAVAYEHPSFTAEMFKGNFRWDLIHPFPEQDPEDKKIGDEFLAKLQEVCEKHIDPIEIDETGEYPEEALKALAEIGTFGMKISKDYGGLGFSQYNYSRALSLLGSYCQSTVTWVSAHQSIGVPQPLKLFGTEEQKKKYLPRLAAGEISAFALTEPHVGSDPAKMTVTAMPTEDGEHYIINGEKLWCTNGPKSSIIVVMAKTPSVMKHGKERTMISAFVVEMNTPGIEVSHICKFMGLRGISNGQITFKDVKVPKENIIGKEGMGLRIALSTLNIGRLGIPAASAGAGKLSIKFLQKWGNERVQWGRPIGKHQSQAKKISQVAANTFAMESIVWLTSALTDREGVDIRLEAAIAKYFCTEAAWKLGDDVTQVRGGRGYERAKSLWERGEDPMPIERALRDARIGRIFEGSSEVIHLILAREAMDPHFSRVMPLMMPKPGQKESKMQLIMNAAKFYISWYPGLYFPKAGDYNVKNLSNSGIDHLAYIERNCRKVARTIFHTMAKFGPKLEYQQILLGNFVDIGVDLFAMAAVLTYSEHLMNKMPNDKTPMDVADLFCQDARQRIEQQYRIIARNHNKLYDKVGGEVLDGKLSWLYTDIIHEFPPKYRTPPEGVPYFMDTLEEGGADMPVKEQPKKEEAPEPVAK